ncbi:MAG: hypothetical protein RI897_4516 [Verrucomicrobiota bacterium]
MEAIGEGAEEFHFFGGDFAVGHDDFSGGVEEVALVEGGDFLERLDGVFQFGEAAAILGPPAQGIWGKVDGGGSGCEGLLGCLGMGGGEVREDGEDDFAGVGDGFQGVVADGWAAGGKGPGDER